MAEGSAEPKWGPRVGLEGERDMPSTEGGDGERVLFIDTLDGCPM